MRQKRPNTIYADDAVESVGTLLRLRLPWLAMGLILGAATTLLVSKFEAILAADVRLAFFIPLIVYLSDAVGTQTQTIYVRNLIRRSTKLSTYLLKEFLLGLLLGGIFGLLTGVFALVWLGSHAIALSVGLAMSASIASATVVALLITALLKREHQDPAIGAGPFTTVIQDMISLMIYFVIAATILAG